MRENPVGPVKSIGRGATVILVYWSAAWLALIAATFALSFP